MKFFYLPASPMAPISNYCSEDWAYLYDVPSILESYLPLYYLYSTHHSQNPKNVDPNIVFSSKEIPVANDENCDLSTSSPKHLYLRMGDIQREYVHDSYSQRLLESLRFLNCKSELSNRDNVFGHCPIKRDNDISLSK